jgi:uncharacterized damage-inducible protein DinB
VSPALEEKQVLLGALSGQREHVLDALEGLDTQGLGRSLLPSGWSCLGLVNHLSLDVERFWFQAVVAGDEGAIEEVLGASDNAWNVSADERGEDVLRRYKENVERADAIIASHSLDAAPAWWPDFFGSWRLHSLREIVIHVMVEVATHAGHLDVARELIDGKQHLVLTD